MEREDYLMRLIQQVAAVIRRIAGLSQSGEHDRAIDEAASAWDQVFGVPRDLVERVDGPTLAALLRSPEHMRAAADLLIEEARARTSKGDPVHALSCYRTAQALYLEARAIAPLPNDEGTLLELARHVPLGIVDPRYKGA